MAEGQKTGVAEWQSTDRWIGYGLYRQIMLIGNAQGKSIDMWTNSRLADNNEFSVLLFSGCRTISMIPPPRVALSNLWYWKLGRSNKLFGIDDDSQVSLNENMSILYKSIKSKTEATLWKMLCMLRKAMWIPFTVVGSWEW